MLINIPEQINCSYCDFCDYELGRCFLAVVKDNNKNSVEKCAVDGYGLGKENECRPDWCPFKSVKKQSVETSKCKKCGLCET